MAAGKIVLLSSAPVFAVVGKIGRMCGVGFCRELLCLPLPALAMVFLVRHGVDQLPRADGYIARPICTWIRLRAVI